MLPRSARSSASTLLKAAVVTATCLIAPQVAPQNASLSAHASMPYGQDLAQDPPVTPRAISQDPIETIRPAPADMVIWGGPIYTARDAQAMVEAVAIRDGRFVFIGSRAQAETYVSDQTTVLSLDGNAMYPGFTDSHAHLSGIGLRELTLNLEGLDSLKSFKQAIADWRRDHPTDAIVEGRGWIETHWAEGRFPTRWDLDAVVPDVPVILTRADSHALVANSKALAMVGIDGTTQAPAGGAITTNALGEATGLLIDAAMGLVDPLRPELDDAAVERAIRTGADVYARYGWTGMHNMSVPWRNMEIMETLAVDGDMPIRVYNSLNSDEARRLFASGQRTIADGRVITRAIKLYMDGALGSRGAALLEPYSDADTRGLLLMTPAQGKPIMEEALARGFQINTHAIGDRGNRILLNWYEEVFKGLAPISRPIAQPRWRIEHAQILNAADLSRFQALDVIPSMQPSHAIGDFHFAPARLGDARLDGAYAWTSLIESGVIIAGGSDAPVERGDPMIEFYAAVARRDLTGFQGNDWRAQEAVTREQALKMFTIWAAMASFQEDELGSIALGKRADLTVLDADIMTIEEAAIPRTKALMTIVDGEIVYQVE